MQSGGVTLRLYSAYQGVASPELSVIVDVTNNTGGPITSAAYESSYVGPDGAQVPAEVGYEPQEVQPGATARVSVFFPGSAPGGEYFYKAYADDFLTEINLQIAVGQQRWRVADRVISDRLAGGGITDPREFPTTGSRLPMVRFIEP